MALTLPTAQDLDTFSHDETSDFTSGQKTVAIQQAGDLLWLYTRVESDPPGEQAARVVKWGILDMAWSLLVSTENKSEAFSPFSSERIGSYSYSKAASQAARGTMPDVAWFTAAIGILNDGSGNLVVWSSSEEVFPTEYQERRAYALLHDPSIIGTGNWPGGE